ncbi:hypothetical protein [Lactobacillus sp. LL6]|uniref:hypothetical protein n=1 Tax=Lactobacillus sp. LL6 TaxID=2596827 RepID=UPI001184764C|nr:hypothetical protein [Lactobacillus sp. LL6]TSO26134.1 hypothetical protein FOD82_03425 [Lactobacillus sp. LL6]
MKKKIVFLMSLLVILGMGLSLSKQTANASFASKYHLKAYIMPKKYRGTWHHGRNKLKISSRRVNGYSLYKFPQHSVIPYKSKVYLVQKDGTGITLAAPQVDGFGLKRSGKFLIWQAFGSRIKYHR